MPIISPSALLAQLGPALRSRMDPSFSAAIPAPSDKVCSLLTLQSAAMAMCLHQEHSKPLASPPCKGGWFPMPRHPLHPRLMSHRILQPRPHSRLRVLLRSTQVSNPMHPVPSVLA